MNKVKKALEQIENKKQAPDALEYLTMLKSELSGREMSPDDFNTYEKLGEMEHSLYRYNSLLNAGLIDDAEKEVEKFFSMSQSSDGTLVLKGGISNCRYVWQTEKGACEACQALDGTEFETLDDVPERPHPNCKCDIVPIENKKDDDKKDDNEPCDYCPEILEQIEQVIVDGEILQEEIQNDLDNINTTLTNYSNFNSNYLNSLLNDLVALEQPYNTLMQVISIFITNWIEMKDAAVKGGDKYFHAKANCEAAQRGLLGEILAEAFGNLREISDNYRNLKEKRMSIEASLQDIKEDLEANKEGRDLGHRHPLFDAYDMLRHRIPNGFPERYRKK